VSRKDDPQIPQRKMELLKSSTEYEKAQLGSSQFDIGTSKQVSLERSGKDNSERS